MNAPFPLLAAASLLAAACCVLPATAAEAGGGVTLDKTQAEQMLRQVDQLADDVARLRTEMARPRTREEAFAQCMQAARGATSAMAAESIGEHCDLLLKK